MGRDDLDEMLALLGYDVTWLHEGVLTLETLQAQAAAFRQPDADPHTEHYRNAALQAFLRQHTVLTDDQLRGLFAIDQAEQRTVLRHDAIHSLLHRDLLTDAQLDMVEARYDEPKLRQLVRRRRLLGRLAASPEPETLDACIESGDRAVHEALLGLADLPVAHLERLAHRGANVSIRRRAAARLERR